MKLFCPITSLKFVGTISLGLLTGISYTTSTILLPSLAQLPSATHARQTLTYIQTTATRQILTLASISSLSLITAYSMASPRNKHPYLLWVALMSFLGGQGVELWYHGLERFYLLGGSKTTRNTKISSEKSMRESGYVDVDDAISGSESDLQAVNGEKVEVEMNKEKTTQWVRTAVSGLGAAMVVVGLWGDGA